MIDIAGTLASIRNAFDILKTMKDAGKSFDAATSKGTIAELMMSLADANTALVEARDEISWLSKEADKLRDALRFKAENTIRLNQLVYEIKATVSQNCFHSVPNA